jgi:hypothetical protein
VSPRLKEAMENALIVLFAPVGIAFFGWMLATFAANGAFVYRTKLNYSNPVSIPFNEQPLLFLAMFCVQLALALAFLGGWAQGAYHLARVAFPKYRLPLEIPFKAFRPAIWTGVAGMLLTVIWLLYTFTVLALN